MAVFPSREIVKGGLLLALFWLYHIHFPKEGVVCRPTEDVALAKDGAKHWRQFFDCPNQLTLIDRFLSSYQARQQCQALVVIDQARFRQYLRSVDPNNVAQSAREMFSHPPFYLMWRLIYADDFAGWHQSFTDLTQEDSQLQLDALTAMIIRLDKLIQAFSSP